MNEVSKDMQGALDPSGPPQPPQGLTGGDIGKMLFAGVGTAAAALGVVGVTLVGGGVRRTAGATRSCQLKWEQREVQIEQAVAHHGAIEVDQPRAKSDDG